jgi:hypothetical protein
MRFDSGRKQKLDPNSVTCMFKEEREKRVVKERKERET